MLISIVRRTNATWLPPGKCKRLAKAPDYPERVRDAIKEMHRQVGPLKFAANGLARRGVPVRHLVMPGQIDEATAIFGWLADEISPDTYVNIMGQYRPEFEVGQPGRSGKKYDAIDRRPERNELRRARDAARRWIFATRRMVSVQVVPAIRR